MTKRDILAIAHHSIRSAECLHSLIDIIPEDKKQLKDHLNQLVQSLTQDSLFLVKAATKSHLQIGDTVTLTFTQTVCLSATEPNHRGTVGLPFSEGATIQVVLLSSSEYELDLLIDDKYTSLNNPRSWFASEEPIPILRRSDYLEQKIHQ